MRGRRIKKALRRSKRLASKGKAKAKRVSAKAVARSKRVLARAGVNGAAVDKAFSKVKSAVKKEGRRQLAKGKRRLAALKG